MALRAGVLSLVSLWVAIPSFASLRSYDGFADLTSTSGTGWSGGWNRTISALGTRVAGDLPGAQFSTTDGKLALVTNSTYRNVTARRTVDVTAYSDMLTELNLVGKAGNSFWMSWLMQVPAAANQNSQTYSMDLGYMSGSFSPELSVGRLYDSTSGTRTFGMQYGYGAATTFVAAPTYTPDASSHLFAIQIEFVDGYDRVRLYVDPSNTNWTPAIDVVTNLDLSVDTIRMSYSPGVATSSPMYLDEVRIGSSAGDVTVPEPGIALSGTLVTLLAMMRRPTRDET